jgi:hypothetical protein
MGRKLLGAIGRGMITTMRRSPARPATPDLFATEMVRGSPEPAAPVTKAAADRVSQRHVLPKDLPNAVKHLTDTELDLLITAAVEEAKRRGSLPPSLQQNSDERERLSSKNRRQAELATVALTRTQINAVRAAFKAGSKPSQIARQFGISQSDVRKVLMADTTAKRGT